MALVKFLIGSIVIIVGLSIFLIGVDIGITPVGNLTGSIIIKSNKAWIVVLISLILGFFISIAEPDLHILAQQVEAVTSGAVSKNILVVVVSMGIAALLSFGLMRIAYNIPGNIVFTALYGIILIMSFFSLPEFLAIAFDASGATTGALTVPFILALAAGTSAMKKNSKASEEDSFGLVGVTSTGAIIGVLIMSLFYKTTKLTGILDNSGTKSIFDIVKTVSLEIFAALAPLLIFFFIFQATSFKLSKRAFFKIIKGFIYTYVGLVMFLSGVNAGFMKVGVVIGESLASHKILLVLFGFLLGFVTILAEPAVHVLTHQIEDVTSGYVRRRIVLAALSVGVGLAVALSVLRIIVPGIQLWHYLLPGFLISVLLTYFVPNLFVGIAFDSGGVASGPMTATFILAFAQGAAEKMEGANALDGFGTIAIVALTPIIALQVLGLIFKLKSIKED